MTALTPPVCDFGLKAPAFSLPDTEAKLRSFDDLRGANGTLIVFMCNHSPYVLAILDRLIRDARDLQALGIGVAGICSNDAQAYPADSPEEMRELARARSFPFAYLHDHDQSVARAYGAVCTPDFFGYNAQDELQYRGRLDASGAKPSSSDLARELYDGMRLVAQTGSGPREQIASIGCSIKWKAS